jgi:hypothetical protein
MTAGGEDRRRVGPASSASAGPPTEYSVLSTQSEAADALRQFLAADGEFAAGCEIRRQPSEYRSSFALEEITVSLADGRNLSVIFKDLGWHSLTLAGQQAKPVQFYDPAREIEIYRRVLAGCALGTARCYGAIVDPPRQRYWLFLEKAPGAELYQYGELDAWRHAARWLAALHYDGGVRRAAESAEVLPRLLRYDAAYFRAWVDRAVEFTTQRRGALAAAPLVELSRRYDDVVHFLASLPVGFIHGEFYASNVLVDNSQQPARVCPVDWELAGIGPGVIDLVALVCGKWVESQRAELIGAYRSGLPAEHPWWSDAAALSRAVDFARLHLAVQWLGWSSDWTPPPAHAHDWLREAVSISARLGL